MAKGYVIAIDGPVASGKGTIAPLLAKRLNGFYLQTGAMYRAVAFYCFQNGIDIHIEDNVIKVLPDIQIAFVGNKVFLNTIDVTQNLRSEEVSQGASFVARIPSVRRHLVQMQQQIAQRKLDGGVIVVAEGRDTATRVFPHAAVTLFLTAAPEVRAKRRQKQKESQTGEEQSFDQVLSEVKARDKQDSERAMDPLVSEPEKHGYIVVNNSELNEEQTLDQIVNVLQQKGLSI